MLRGLSLGMDNRARVLAANLARAGIVTITQLRDGLAIETESYIGDVRPRAPRPQHSPEDRVGTLAAHSSVTHYSFVASRESAV